MSVNYFLCMIAGVLWYLQFFFYGMGSTQMGKYDFASWTLHMAFIIVTSNAIGLLTNEWKGCSRRIILYILAGIATLIASTVIIGYGNKLAYIRVSDDPQNLVRAYFDDPGVFGFESFNGYMSKYETTNEHLRQHRLSGVPLSLPLHGFYLQCGQSNN